MRIHAAIVLSLASVLCASCVRSAEPSPALHGAGGALVEPQDDGDLGSEPPIDLGESPPPPSPGVPRPSAPFGDPTPGEAPDEPEGGGNFTYYACVFVKNSSETLRSTFCGSLRTRQLRAVCYSHVHDIPEEWGNYCYDAFYQE